MLTILAVSFKLVKMPCFRSSQNRKIVVYLQTVTKSIGRLKVFHAAIPPKSRYLIKV